MLVGIELQDTKTPPANSSQVRADMAQHLGKVASERCQVSFARVFNHFAPRIRSYALKQFGNEAQAMELVQDTLSNVWQKAHLFNSDKGAASTWIFTIARNIRFDMLRKQQNRKEDVCSDDLYPILCEHTASPDDVALDEQMELHRIGSMFAELPEKQRLVIEAIYIEGKSQQEVADQLSIPLGTVKSRTRLALQRLREMLNDNE